MPRTKIRSLLCFAFLLPLPAALAIGGEPPNRARILQNFSDFKRDYQSLPNDPSVKILMKNGIVSLAVSGKRRKAFSTYETLQEKQLLIRNLTLDFFGTRLEARYAHLTRSLEAPTLVIHAGFIADFESGDIGYLIENFTAKFPQYNLLMIEALSSAAFSKRNCFYTLGGIHEPYMIREILNDYWNTMGTQNRESILLGSSSSSFSVIATPILVNREDTTEQPMKGSFLSSGYLSMRRVYDWFVATANRENYPSYKKFIRKLGFKKVNEKYTGIAPSKDTEECRALAALSVKEGFGGLLRGTFAAHRASFAAAWSDLYGSHAPVPQTYEALLDGVALDSVAAQVETPFFWLQSMNDPLPVEGHYPRFFESSDVSANPLISGDLKNYGGHGAFEIVYGKDWLFSRIALFAESFFSHP